MFRDVVPLRGAHGRSNISLAADLLLNNTINVRLKFRYLSPIKTVFLALKTSIKLSYPYQCRLQVKTPFAIEKEETRQRTGELSFRRKKEANLERSLRVSLGVAVKLEELDKSFLHVRCDASPQDSTAFALF